MVNVLQGVSDKAYGNKFDELLYDDNYESMIWASPAKIIKMYMSREISLTSTQYIIVNILASFKNFKDIVSYLKTIQYCCLNSFAENLIEKRCLTIPFNMAIVKSNSTFDKKRGVTEVAYFEADYDFPFLE